MLYNINNGKINEIKELEFKSEKELQNLCENNLHEFVNLEFVASEFIVSGFRLDTISYDKESNSFVIIEYKNQKNISVIDQGYTYLSTMFNHKADFVLCYNNRFNVNKSINEFDWSQSKVMFICPNFTKYQINSINFKDLPIELWKIKRYKNSTVSLEQILPMNSNESIKKISPILENYDKEGQVSKETKIFSEDDLLIDIPDNILDIYNELKEYILSLDDNINLNPTKLYIGFNRGRKSVISIKIQKSSLVLWINSNLKEINDPKNIIRDVSNIGHHGNGNCEIKIYDRKNIGYIEDILKEYVYNLD